jgi:hypothetical protein
MAESVEAYSKRYSGLSNEDIVRLTADVANLVPNARAALRLELQRRGMGDSVDWMAQPVTAPVVRKESSGMFRRLIRNFLIFIACDIPYLVVVGFLFSVVRGIDVWAATAALTKALLNCSAVLAMLATWRTFRLKTIWIIGIAGPAVLILFSLFYGLLHRTISQ